MAQPRRIDELRWYVIQTHPKQEDRVGKNLATCNVQFFSPKIRKPRYNQFTGKPIYVSGPLFPCYIFARFQIAPMYHSVRFTRGVRSVIAFEEYPAPVEDSAIEFIQSRIGDDGYVIIGDALGNRERFKPGSEVIVLDGPFKNLSGIFEREMPGGERVRILLQALSYQVHAELKASAIRSSTSNVAG